MRTFAVGLVFLCVHLLGIFVSAGSTGPDDPVAAVSRRFGGEEGLARFDRVEIRGALEGERPREFRWRQAGSSSRFELGDHVRLDRGLRRTESMAARPWMPEQELTPGWEMGRLLPHRVVPELGRSLKYQGEKERRHWFSGVIPRGGFLGYDPPPAEVEVAVDAVTAVPVLLRIRIPGLDRDVEIRWEQYQDVEGLPVPRTIRRLLGRSEWEVWRIEAVTLDAVFGDDVFTPAGGAR